MLVEAMMKGIRACFDYFIDISKEALKLNY